MSVWKIFWRDGRTEALVCERDPVELVGLVDQMPFAVQFRPVAGPSLTLRCDKVGRAKRLR
jgi:hypothetical protein